VEQRCGGGDDGLDIPRAATIAVEPGEAALDHPTARMHGEADFVLWLADNPYGDAGRPGNAVGVAGGVGDDATGTGRGCRAADRTV
jgi:hypothetical protein